MAVLPRIRVPEWALGSGWLAIWLGSWGDSAASFEHLKTKTEPVAPRDYRPMLERLRAMYEHPPGQVFTLVVLDDLPDSLEALWEQCPDKVRGTTR